MEASRSEQQQGWDVLTKYQNLSDPSHNGLFQGDSQTDKSRTTCQSGISVPSVLICPSAPLSRRANSVTEGAPAGLDQEASQVTNLKWRLPQSTLLVWQSVCWMPCGLALNTTEPDPSPPEKPQNFMETCRKAQEKDSFVFSISGQ